MKDLRLANLLSGVPVANVVPDAFDLTDKAAFVLKNLHNAAHNEAAIELAVALAVFLEIGFDKVTQHAIGRVFFGILAFGTQHMHISWNESLREFLHVHGTRLAGWHCGSFLSVVRICCGCGFQSKIMR